MIFYNVMLIKKEDGKPEVIKSRAENLRILEDKVNRKLSKIGEFAILKLFTTADEVHYLNCYFECSIEKRRVWDEYYLNKIDPLLESGSKEASAWIQERHNYLIKSHTRIREAIKKYDFSITSDTVKAFMLEE